MDLRSKSSGGKKESIQEMKARMRKTKGSDSEALMDPFEKIEKSFAASRKRTGLTFDDSMSLHFNPWDSGHPECPGRYLETLKRFRELGLVERCHFINPERITENSLAKVHIMSQFDNLKAISTLPIDRMEVEASKYDSIYFNDQTFGAALLAAGSVLASIRAVCQEEVHNAFALVRPPGHHAMVGEYCGYCYFNNVAIGAKEALANGWAQRILIIDFDVHHGQATQQMFYDSDKVLYFSFHRYEHGKFWPNLRESNFDFIGEGDGKGYNINVPLNTKGIEDKDYMAVIFNILLPIAYEFNPDLILFSAGYDACIGCPEGEMKLSPGFYGQFITLLGGLANGKQVVCLEGGYFLPSLAEGASMSLRSLLDDPPAMVKPFGLASPCMVEVINNLKFMLHPYWKCLFQEVYLYDEPVEDLHTINIKYLGVPDVAPFLTRDCYPTRSLEVVEEYGRIVQEYKREYAQIKDGGICYAFDKVMFKHKTPENFPERPERLIKLYDMFKSLKLDERCAEVPSRQATKAELLLLHEEEYINSLFSGSFEPDTRDLYFGGDSLDPVLTSAGCVLNVIDAVMQDKHRAGVALVRPPGHHAEVNKAFGFCFVSNVALGAKYILKNYGTKRILILDFDVHHGNGTQKAFYDSKDVLYISVHQHNNGHFFPPGDDGDFDKVGQGDGLGYNVNIPFNKDYPTDHMGDNDYLPIFHRIILPIAYSFGPEVVIVSAGFDAGLDDPIGNYKVTPEAFGHFIQLLKPLAQGKLILALEGGYNVNTVAYCMSTCVKVLLGDALPKISYKHMHKSTLKTIQAVMNTQKKYWPILSVDKKLPNKIKSLTLLKADVPLTILNPGLDNIQKLTIDEYKDDDNPAGDQK